MASSASACETAAGAASSSQTDVDGATRVRLRIFEREKHIRYFLSNINMLPNPYTGADTNR